MATQPNEQSRPLIPRERVLVALAGDVDFDLQCAREYGLGVEVQHLAMPPWLGTDCSSEIERLAPKLGELPGVIGLHGPFMDMTHCSPDPAIVKLCRQRYIEAFEMATELKAGYVVLHSQYNTMLRFPEYPSLFHRLSMEFWPGVIEEADRRGLEIYVENMFDDNPEPIRRLVEELNHPRFNVCFDVAHAIIYSELNLTNWIESLGPHIRHVHINDCDGVNDLHLALGKGTLNLTRAIDALEALGRDLTYTLETHRGGKDSAEFLGLAPLDAGT